MKNINIYRVAIIIITIVLIFLGPQFFELYAIGILFGFLISVLLIVKLFSLLTNIRDSLKNIERQIQNNIDRVEGE